MKRRLKLLFGVWGLTNGGAERVLSVLCNKLAKMDCEVHLYIRYKEKNEYHLDPDVIVHRAFDRSLEDLDRIEKKENLRKRIIHRLRSIKKIPFLGSLIEALRLYYTGGDQKYLISSVIDEVKPDFVIPFLLGAQIEFYHALKMCKNRTPFIFTVRNYPKKYVGAERILQTFFAKKADYIWCQTDSQKEYYSKPLQKKAFVLGNPINQVFIDAPIRDIKKIERFIAAGRLTKQKNYQMMLNGFALACKENDIVLDIFGDGEMKDEIKKMISDLSMDERIFLHDRTENILSEYLKSDCFLMTSDFEGMPNALMEAMCVGLPCICTDCLSGPRELIGDDERGYLVPCNDNKALRNAILETVLKKEISIEKSKRASSYIRSNYNATDIAKKFISICEKKGEK